MDTIGSLLSYLTQEENIPPKIYSEIELSNYTRSKLLSYQKEHTVCLLRILLSKYIALDASDTGTGKTYVASAICKELNRKPIIVCPKTLIYNWADVLDYYKVKHYDIVNYETLKNGKTYCNLKCKTRKKSSYIEINGPDSESIYAYQWSVPSDTILILDEVHRCKNYETDNGKFLLSVKQLIDQKIPVLMLSATICEKLTDMKILFYLYQLIPNIQFYKNYIKRLKQKYPQYQTPKNSDNTISEENYQAMMIYQEVVDYTKRIKISQIGDKFPQNQWCAQQFIAEDSDKISNAYQKISKLMEKLKNYPSQFYLARIVKLKQEIEFRKAPIFLEQAQLYLANGKSVIIFVNYLDTLHFLAQELKIVCQIHGRQTLAERLEAINLFQSNQKKIIICQSRAGGTGISLHDLHGNHPRVTLINYPNSATDLIQILGRAVRSGAKTPVLQRIIFVANVEYEKCIMQTINRKLSNISSVNDGVMDGYQYPIKQISKTN